MERQTAGPNQFDYLDVCYQRRPSTWSLNRRRRHLQLQRRVLRMRRPQPPRVAADPCSWCVRVHLQIVSNFIEDTNRQTDRETDRHQESNLVHFVLKMWHLAEIIFNNFPDNQLTKFRLFIGWTRIFIPTLNLYEASRFVSPHRTDTNDKETNGRISDYLCPFICLCLRWSLTH